LAILLTWQLTGSIGRVVGDTDVALTTLSLIDEWQMETVMTAALREYGLSDAEAVEGAPIAKILTTHKGWWQRVARDSRPASRALEEWLGDADVRHYLRVNRFDGILWYNKETYESLLDWLEIEASLEFSEQGEQPTGVVPRSADYRAVIAELAAASRASEYQVEKLLALAQRPMSGPPSKSPLPAGEG